MSPWYTDMENLAALARYLIDKDGEIDTVLFIQKPSHWEPEWEEFLSTEEGKSYRDSDK